MKKKYVIAALAAIILFLVVLIPLASTNPDGLEKVVQSMGGNEQNSFWSGLMQDYSVSFLGNSYVSTLLAGIVGVVIVFASAFVLGKRLSAKRESNE